MLSIVFPAFPIGFKNSCPNIFGAHQMGEVLNKLYMRITLAWGIGGPPDGVDDL